MTVDEILHEVESLPPDDLRRLRDEVQRRLVLTVTEAEREEEFARYMEAKGVITRPDRSGLVDPSKRPPPIPFQGEPVSETLIRERR